jgi:hypothetical protein
MKINVEIPRVPNFLLNDRKETFRVQDFSDKELREIGRLWTQALLKKAKGKRVV